MPEQESHIELKIGETFKYRNIIEMFPCKGKNRYNIKILFLQSKSDQNSVNKMRDTFLILEHM